MLGNIGHIIDRFHTGIPGDRSFYVTIPYIRIKAIDFCTFS